MQKETILYKKVGRRYKEYNSYLDEKGLPEGLYMFYKHSSGEGMKNMLYYTKLHDFKEMGKFCDFYKAYQEQIQNQLRTKLDEFYNSDYGKKGYTSSDLTDVILKTLSEIK